MNELYENTQEDDMGMFVRLLDFKEKEINTLKDRLEVLQHYSDKVSKALQKYKVIDRYYGQTIRSIDFTEHKVSIRFEDYEPLNLFAHGDCCSESWFEDAGGLSSYVGGTLDGIELVHLKDVWKDKDETEQLTHYSAKIKTSKGVIDFEMRNESNGYYGGHITINEDDQYANNSIHAVKQPPHRQDPCE